ncbi:hypothetical protein AB4Z32_26785, partial [Massilia sp. 2TAF26]|uniref:hypothetical protein n=1 Tax=Massilia sp. 2TAF26 TaxID=3233012 RepID=UPI003F97EA59
ISDDYTIGRGLAQDPNDLLFGKTFLHLASMYKNNMKTNFLIGYKIPIRSGGRYQGSAQTFLTLGSLRLR